MLFIGYEIYLNILVIDVSKAEGQRCPSSYRIVSKTQQWDFFKWVQIKSEENWSYMCRAVLTDYRIMTTWFIVEHSTVWSTSVEPDVIHGRCLWINPSNRLYRLRETMAYAIDACFSCSGLMWTGKWESEVPGVLVKFWVRCSWITGPLASGSFSINANGCSQ